jgi:hypothetical protein
VSQHPAAAGRGGPQSGVLQQFQTFATAKSSFLRELLDQFVNMLHLLCSLIVAEEELQDPRGPRDAGLLPVCCRWLW